VSQVIVRVDKTKLENYVRLFPEKMNAVLEQWKEEGSLETMEYMRGIAPFKTGFLRESITRRTTPKGFTVYPTAPYAKYVDKGTSPHMIFPRNATVLSWTAPAGGQIFARYVHHPGTRGQFFIQRTKEAMRTVLKQLLRFIMREKM